MEVFSKGIHRALVPLESNMENVAGVELIESASTYRMLTQMDLMKFLKGHEPELKHVLDRTLRELSVVVEPVFGVTGNTKVIDAIKSMRAGALNAVPIVESTNPATEDHSQLVNVQPNTLITIWFGLLRVTLSKLNISRTVYCYFACLCIFESGLLLKQPTYSMWLRFGFGITVLIFRVDGFCREKGGR